LTKEKSALALEKASLSRANKIFKKQVHLQLVLKFEHQEKMAEFTLQVKQVALEQTIMKQKHSEEKSPVELLAKNFFQTWNYQQREIQKEKQEERKEATKDKKAKKVADRLQIVSSDMLRTNQINGGTFPSPGLTLQQVSSFSFV
jgi:hypothetical protein